jgi:subtilase family serine protease
MIPNPILTSDVLNAGTENKASESGPPASLSQRFRRQFLAAVLVLAGSGLGSAQIARPLPGNVSPWVARAQRLGAADDNQQVTIAAYLSFRNQAALESLIINQSTLGNAKYGQFLSPEEFRAQFAPDPAEVKLVQDTLVGLGFTIEHTPASGLFVEANGTVAQVRNAFQVTQDLYSYNGKTLRANAEAPTLPAPIANLVTFIAGLDDSRFLVKPLHVSGGPDAPPGGPFGMEPAVCSTYWSDHSASVLLPPSPYPVDMPWMMCGYTPQQLQQAYGVDKVTQTGRGVRVAVTGVYASPTIVADVNRFSANHGLPPLTSLNFAQNIPPGIYKVPANDPCGPQSWYQEETLDIEAVHEMAPGAFILYVGVSCADSTVGIPEIGLYGIIDNRLADIISNSWATADPEGLTPPGLFQADDAEFMQAVAEGISVLFGSGDFGDVSPFYGIASGAWPADSSWVTAVGGTTVALRNASGEKSEWGWGEWSTNLNNPVILDHFTKVTDSGLASPFSFDIGSGGGISFVEPQPFYQVGVVPGMLSNQTYLNNGTPVPLASPRRVTPDISMDANPLTGVLIGETDAITGDPSYDHGCVKLSRHTQYCERNQGGTSLATPLFAGVLALVNEERFNNSLSPIGFANPALYSLTVGAAGSTAPIIDILPPPSPIAVLRRYFDYPILFVNSMNSAPNPSGAGAIEGADADYWLLTTEGYDAVTGLGTPNVPSLIKALGSDSTLTPVGADFLTEELSLADNPSSTREPASLNRTHVAGRCLPKGTECGNPRIHGHCCPGFACVSEGGPRLFCENF